MKLVSLIIVFFFLTGCTTLKPIELSSIQPTGPHYSGNVIKPGDKINITTTDGKSHVFRATAVTNDSIVGKKIEIPIKDIVSVEKVEISDPKTGLLVSVLMLLGVLMVAASDPMDGAFNGK